MEGLFIRIIQIKIIRQSINIFLCHQVLHFLAFLIPITALNYIAEHGIAKLRYGHNDFYRDKVYKRNEFGKDLAEAYHKVLEQMSPDYVPPKKPSIYDGF